MYNEPIFRRWARRFWSLDYWQRMLLVTGFSALSGSMFIGFINRYALYVYAYTQGVRIPVEGVPYLDLAVTLVSFGVIALAILYSSMVYWMFARVKFIASRYRLYDSKGKKAALLFVYVMLAILSIVIGERALAYLANNSDFPLPHGVETLRTPLVGAIGIVVLIIILALRPAHDAIKRRTAATAALLVTGLMIMAMFTPKVYGAFLREIRFGGGLPVDVTVQKADTVFETIRARLVVYTNNGLLLRKADSGEVLEIYRERISSLAYLDVETAAGVGTLEEPTVDK